MTPEFEEYCPVCGRNLSDPASVPEAYCPCHWKGKREEDEHETGTG